LRSPTFPEALTQVNGSVQFNSDSLNVAQLSGRYNKGELIVKGGIPIFDNKLPVATPLSVALNNTALNVKGLYKGQVNGNLNVGGSVFSPLIRGFVALDNGEVLLAAASTAQASGTAPTNTGGGPVSAAFQGLQVRLGDNIRVLQPPVLSFIASGNIDLEGSVDAPRPSGKVYFKKGNVYLFTTLFRVDERKENFAQFTPAYGLDPLLNLSLRTTVSEVAAGRKTNLNEFADIQAGTLGSIESVRVRANIQGRASQLNTRFSDTLELTSTPSRTQNEILALLSGGITQSLEAGDAQGAVVNFASSAFLNRFQSVVDDVLGDRASFRLFPLLTPIKDNNSNNRSTLNLGAELGYDVTDRFSVSVLQIVTSTNELPQLNLSYDFTDQLRLRSSVNFQGDAVGVLEYRLRF
jgi:translocation and assembly module TamB